MLTVDFKSSSNRFIEKQASESALQSREHTAAVMQGEKETTAREQQREWQLDLPRGVRGCFITAEPWRGHCVCGQVNSALSTHLVIEL